MGFPHKERKEMERREDGGAGSEGMGGRGGWVVGMEADSEPNTRRGGMNINNISMLEKSHNGHHRATKRGNGKGSSVPGLT